MGGFSNASLKGSYAFAMIGTDASANVGAQIARIGSFNADGSGHITAALEDVTDGRSSSPAVQFSGGSYSIDSSGKGTLSLTSVAGTGLMFSITLTSANSGLMIQSDLNATSSGTFSLQSQSAFTLAGLTNGYVFDVSGVDANGAPMSIIGNFQANSNGTVSSCVLDENDGSAAAPSGPLACNAAGSYALDATNGNGATFGRGTLSFAGLSFAFYIVNSTQVELMEEDGQFATSGSAEQQSTPPTQVAAASYAFLIGGASVLGSGGAIARGGRFSTDATGTSLTSVFLDDNNSGGITSINSNNTISSAKFAIDTNNPGSGRGTLTFLASGQASPFSFVFYLASATHGFIQDTSNGVIGDGSILAQNGPFTSLGGNYAVNWSGQNLALGFEEDFVGQYALSSGNSVSGAIDFVELASPSKRNPLFSNISLTGMFSPASDTTMRSTYTYTANAAPSTTFNFAVYIGGSASAPTILLVNTNQNRVDAGTASLQSP